MMPGYLLAAAFHKQAFASATQHQLLAFLQVAAFTNRTAVLPFARVGEPAFVGLPRPGFGGLDRYFDVAAEHASTAPDVIALKGYGRNRLLSN